MRFLKNISAHVLLFFLIASAVGCAQDADTKKNTAAEDKVVEVPEVSEAKDHEADGVQNKPVEDPSGIQWVSLKEAQIKAKETGKKVLIFGYADWCPYCKRMRSETYTDEGVRKRLYDNFIPVELNAEVDDEVNFNGVNYKSRELAQMLQLFSYPMHYFIGSDGQMLGAQPGFLPPDIFGPMLSYVGEDLFGKMDFEKYLKETENVVIEPR